MSKQRRIESRFAWIEASLRYAGKFDKISYGDHFDINPPQISADQASFVEMMNHELQARLDGEPRGPWLEIRKGKIEILRPLPKPPVFDIPDLRRWLQDVITIPFVKIDDFRQVDPDPEVVRSVCDAILRRCPVRLRILDERGTTWRNVSPHSLIDADDRIHLRGFDHEAGIFRDVALTRISDTGPHDRGLKYVGEDNDRDWQETEQFEVRINPAAGVDRARVSVRDYALDRENMSRRVSVPRALARLLAGSYRPETDTPAIPPVIVTTAG